MMVSVVQATALRITEHCGYKTFDPYTYVLGQVWVSAEAEPASENPKKVSWEIVVYGSGGFLRTFRVDNGEYKFGYSWNIGAYKYGDTYYVDLFWYRISMGLYERLNQYTVRLYYDGHWEDEVYRQPLVEIPWP